MYYLSLLYQYRIISLDSSMFSRMPYINIDDTTILVNEIDEIAFRRDTQIHSYDAQMSQLTGGPPVTIAINEGIQETQFDTIKLSLLLVLIAMICIFWSVVFEKPKPGSHINWSGLIPKDNALSEFLNLGFKHRKSI